MPGMPFTQKVSGCRNPRNWFSATRDQVTTHRAIRDSNAQNSARRGLDAALSFFTPPLVSPRSAGYAALRR